MLPNNFNFHLLIVGIFASCFVLVRAQNNGNSKVQAMLTQLQAQIAEIRENYTTGLGAEVASIRSQVSALSAQVAAVEDGQDEEASDSDRITTLEESAQTLTTQIELLEATTTDKFGKLDNINELWRNNFKIVNKTFTAMRQRRKKALQRILNGGGAGGRLPLLAAVRFRVNNNG